MTNPIGPAPATSPKVTFSYDYPTVQFPLPTLSAPLPPMGWSCIADRGVLMLCDPRLHSKAYGRTFLRSLPAMRQSSQIEDVQAFFR